MNQEYFDQIADQWDSLRAGMFGDEVRRVVLERAGLSPESVVVDLGAGTGFLSQAIAPLVSAVHLVDSSAEMLTVARKNLAEFHNVHYHLADGMQIPLPDALADAVVANMYLHHAPEPARAIGEMARLLKPSGRLVIADLDAHAHAWLREEHHDRWMGFAREEVRAWLEAAGLVNILIEDSRQICRSASRSGGETASVSIFVASASKADDEIASMVAARQPGTPLHMTYSLREFHPSVKMPCPWMCSSQPPAAALREAEAEHSASTRGRRTFRSAAETPCSWLRCAPDWWCWISAAAPAQMSYPLLARGVSEVE